LALHSKRGAASMKFLDFFRMGLVNLSRRKRLIL
jgi:hypothetical protein